MQLLIFWFINIYLTARCKNATVTSCMHKISTFLYINVISLIIVIAIRRQLRLNASSCKVRLDSVLHRWVLNYAHGYASIASCCRQCSSNVSRYRVHNAIISCPSMFVRAERLETVRCSEWWSTRIPLLLYI